MKAIYPACGELPRELEGVFGKRKKQPKPKLTNKGSENPKQVGGQQRKKDPERKEDNKVLTRKGTWDIKVSRCTILTTEKFTISHVHSVSKVTTCNLRDEINVTERSRSCYRDVRLRGGFD